MNNDHRGTVRVRFAPSPTGNLHVGGARSAIFNWLFARHVGGTYLVRIEDTDRERSDEKYVQSIMRSFRWLNLMPDEPIVIQSSRINEHKQAALVLMQQGKAYPCFCEPHDAQEKIMQLEEGVGSKYDGHCRDKKYTDKDLEKPHAIRFRLPVRIGAVEFNDVVRGTVSVSYEQLDDFIIVRRDGNPIYNFVVVIDDIFMNITHIIRGEDHISNTPKQILLYQALGKPLPVFAHLPLILGPSGNRLSKRDAAVSVEEYCSMGIMPGALFNYLVRLGWSHGDQEIFTHEEMVQFFTLEKIGKKGSIFDLKKLLWVNGLYIRAATLPEIKSAVTSFSSVMPIELKKMWDAATNLWSEAQGDALLLLHKERAVDLAQLCREICLLASDPEVLDLSLLAKWMQPSTKAMLEAFMRELTSGKTLRHDELLAYAQTIATQHEAKLVMLAQPLRFALVGAIHSPGIFELIEIVGKEISIRRIQKLLDCLR